MQFFYCFKCGDEMRLEFVINMLLAIAIFIMAIMERMPLHNESMVAKEIFCFLIF